MSNIVRKFPIDDFWNIGKSESWFSDMAAKGLHLKGFGRFFVKFEKGKPAKTKYRIDILYKKPSSEQLDVYKECGWDFVANTGLFYIFSSPEDSNTPELHTDLTEQSFTLNNLNKILKRNIIVFSASILLMICMMLGIFFFHDEPYLFFINNNLLLIFSFVFVYLFSLFSAVRNYIYVKNIKSELLNGTPINHKENWKKNSSACKVLNFIGLSITIIALIISITEIVKRDEYTLPDEKVNLPIVRLSDIENNYSLQRESKFYDDNVDFLNNVRYQWSILTPIHYEVVESGIVHNEMWDDKGKVYTPSTSTSFYKLSFKGMSDGLIKDLISRHIYLPIEPLIKVENTSFDQLYYSFRNNTKEIFASWNNNVIYIRYQGKSDIDHIIDLLSELVDEY